MFQQIIDRYYSGNGNRFARDILIGHSRAVADFALYINQARHLGLADADVEEAAMLHDIGIIRTNAPGIGCNGLFPYIRHGVLGADMLRQAGAPQEICNVAERHTGVGLTIEDIKNQHLDLPTDRILVPQSLLEKLICYADKFFSKRPGELQKQKSLDKVIAEIRRFGNDNVTRFMELQRLFGE